MNGSLQRNIGPVRCHGTPWRVLSLLILVLVTFGYGGALSHPLPDPFQPHHQPDHADAARPDAYLASQRSPATVCATKKPRSRTALAGADGPDTDEGAPLAVLSGAGGLASGKARICPARRNDAASPGFALSHPPRAPPSPLTAPHRPRG